MEGELEPKPKTSFGSKRYYANKEKLAQKEKENQS